jgi:c-di-GMP-related signal transduction protein
LVSEIFEHQKIEAIEIPIMRALVASMMVKSTSEKAFIKNQALKGLNSMIKKWNYGALEELCAQT